jgi:DNA-binding beta-propeller fold protein YncE
MGAFGRPRVIFWCATSGLLLAGCGGGGSSPSVTSVPAPTTAATASPLSTPSAGSGCTDASLGVCRIADAGIRHIPIARAGANGLAVDPATGLVYVVINGATSPWCGDKGNFNPGLSIVDPAGNRELAAVATGEGPVWPLVDARRRLVYVAGSGGAGTIAVHDPRNGSLIRSFTIGGRPHDLGLDPLGSLMLVSNTFDKSQTWSSALNVDTGAVTANISVPELPHKVVVDESRRVAYVVSLGSGQITAVDLATGAKVREFSSGPTPQTSAMVFSPTRRMLYVGKTGGATPTSGHTMVAVNVDSGTVVGEVGTFTPGASTPTRPWGGFGLDDASGLLYAAMGNTNFVAVVDVVSLRPLGLFEVDACPWAVTLDVARGQGYASSNQSAALSAFDLTKVMRSLGR